MVMAAAPSPLSPRKRNHRGAMIGPDRVRQTVSSRRDDRPINPPSDTQPRRYRGAMITITMLNQKGGVGKTSTTHHLSGTLALLGQRVLLLDNDPQSSLSQGFWGPAAALELDPSETIAALYRGDRPFPDQVIKPTGIARLDLVPGSEHATRFNVPEPESADPEARECLRDFLADVSDRYDLVLIDCPPNLHLCSWAALAASDFIIVPIQPEDYGAQGLASVQRSIRRVQETANPSLELLGYLFTMVGKKTIHQLHEKTVRANYGADVFDAKVPDAVHFVEAITARLPIGQYKPKGAAAKAIRALADEVLQRIEARYRGAIDTKEEAA
jgi:chromosome partitioning protein